MGGSDSAKRRQYRMQHDLFESSNQEKLEQQVADHRKARQIHRPPMVLGRRASPS